MKEKIQGLFKPTPAKQKRRRNIALIVGGLAEGVVMMGLVDDRPMLKTALHLVAIGFGTKATIHQGATESTD